MKRKLLAFLCVTALSSCAVAEREKAIRWNEAEFEVVSRKTEEHLSLWRAEDGFPDCTSNNLAQAVQVSKSYEEEAIGLTSVYRRGIEVLPPWIGTRTGTLRMSIAEAAYAHKCFIVAKPVYIDIHENYNNYLVSAYGSLNRKARARIVDITNRQ